MPVTRSPLSSTHSLSQRTSSSPISSSKRKNRVTTVFDAVAGRVSYRGFLPPAPIAHTKRDTASSTSIPNAPEEVLFRRRGAPERYEEDDFYWADCELAPGIELPDSDLLKAVHAYAAGFYGRTGRTAAFGSLDETALIAVGVLLEEWGEAVLGETGHEVFLEGEERKAQSSTADSKTGKGKSVKDDAWVKAVAGETREGRRRKRRKTEHEADDGNGNGNEDD